MKGDVKDRSVNLGLWKKIFPYSDLAIPTTGETSYSSTIFALAEMVATAFSMIKLVNFKYIYGDGDLPGWFHRMLYINVENLLSMQAFSDDLNVTLLIILSAMTFILWTAIIATIVTASRKVSDSTSMMWLSSTPYFAIPWIRNLLMLKSNIFLCPLIENCITIIQSSRFSGGYRTLAVILLLSMVVDLFFIVWFSIDINFKARNILQGRTYKFFLIKVIGLWLLIILKYIIADQDNYGLDVFSNILTFLHSMFLLFKLFQWKNYFLQPKLEMTYGIMILVYIIESMGALIFSLNRDLKFVLDMDLVAIISYPLFYLLYRGLENKSADQILSKRSHTSFDSLDSAILYLEKLFFCFGQAQDDRFKMYLQMNIVSHCNSCKDPMCLCPLLRETIDVKSGSAGRSAKSTFTHFLNKRKGASQHNTTVNFDSSKYVDKLKIQNKAIAKLITTGDPKELKIRTTDVFNADEVYSMVAIDNAEKFSLVFCSFFRTVKADSFAKDTFELMYSYFKFLLTEYNNPVTALYAIYDYIYSHEFQRDSSLPRMVLMQNLLRYSKRQALTLNLDDLRIFEANRGLSSRAGMLIPKDEDFISSNLDHQSIGDSGFSMSQILGFRRRLHQVRLTNMDLILKKIKLYNWLFEPEGDFRVASALGSELYLKSRQLKRELAELNLLDQLNPRLIREAIVYEVCVKERDSIPPDYAKRYREAVARFQVFSKSIHSVQSKNRFSPYSSTHVVVFARPVGEQFKISQFSENATSFFEADANTLQNANLSNFILPTLAKEHDELLHSYLNGEQSSQKRLGTSSIIHSVCRTKKGNMNSVMVIPRLEVVFTQEIFIGGLISHRKKNQEPVVYCDRRGKILGCNQMTTMTFGGSPIPSSLFFMCPRLENFIASNITENEEKLKDKHTSGSKWSAGKTVSLSKSLNARGLKAHNTNRENQKQMGDTMTPKYEFQNFQLESFWFTSFYNLETKVADVEFDFGDQSREELSKTDIGTSDMGLIKTNTYAQPIKLQVDAKPINTEVTKRLNAQKTFLENPGFEGTKAAKREHAKPTHTISVIPEKVEEEVEDNEKPQESVFHQLSRALKHRNTNPPAKDILNTTVDVETQTYSKMPEIKEIVLLSSKPVSQRITGFFNIWLQQIRDLPEQKQSRIFPSIKLSTQQGAELSPEMQAANYSPKTFSLKAVGNPRVTELLQLSPETVHQLFLLKDLVEKNLASQSPSSLSVIQHIFPEEFAEADLQIKMLQQAEKQHKEAAAKPNEGVDTPNFNRGEKQKQEGSSPDRVLSPSGAGKPLVAAIFQILAVQKPSPPDGSPPSKMQLFEKKPSMAENSSLANLLQPGPSTKVDAVTKEVSTLLNGILEGISVDCGTEEPEELLQIVLQPLLVDSISRSMLILQQQSPANSKIRVPSMQLLSGIGSGLTPNANAHQQQASHLTPVFQSPFDLSKSSQSKSNIDKPSAVQLHSSSSAKVDVLQDDMWLRADLQANSNKEETSKEGRVREAGRPGSKVEGQANKLAMIDLNKDVSSLISSRLSNRSNQVIVMMRWAINRSDSSLKYKMVEFFVYAIALLLIAAKIVFLIYAQVATDGLFAAQESIRTVALSAHASAWLHKQSIKGLLQSKAFEDEGVFYTVNNNGQQIFSPEFPAYILKALTAGQLELANNQFFKETYILEYPSTNPLKPQRASALTLLFDVIFMYNQFQGYSNRADMNLKLNQDYQKLLVDINDQTLGAYNILQIKLNELSDATFSNASVLNLMTLMLFCTNIFFCVVFIVSTRLMGYLQNSQLSQAADLMNKVDKKYFLKAVDTIFSRSKKSADGFESGGTIRRGDATRFTEFEGEDQWDNDFQYKLRLAANVRDDDFFQVQQKKTPAKPYTVKVWETKTLTFKDRKFLATEIPSTGRELNRLDKSDVPDSARLELEVSPRLTAEADGTRQLVSPREPVTTYYEPVARKSTQPKNRSRDGYSRRSNKQARIQDSGLKLNLLSLIAVAIYLPTILEIVDYVGVNFNSVAMAERVNLMRGSRRAPDYILASVVTSSIRSRGVDFYSSTDTTTSTFNAMLGLVDSLRLNQEDDIQSVLNDIKTCDPVMMRLTANLTDMDLCRQAYNMGDDRRLKTGLDSVAIRLRGLSQYFDTKLKSVADSRVASTMLIDTAFWEIDMANFFTTIPWRQAIDTYLTTVSEVIRSGMNNYVWYTVAFIVGTLLLLTVFRLWWLQVLLHDWIQLKHTFLMQNQDVLTNPYVSSFFGKGAMSILGGIQGGNSGKH